MVIFTYALKMHQGLEAEIERPFRIKCSEECVIEYIISF